MKYRTVLLVAIALFYASFLGGGAFNFSYSSSSHDSVRVVMKSTPMHVAAWFVALVAYSLPFVLRDRLSWSDYRAGLVRRFFGFAIDFHICFVLATVPFTLVALGLESQSTGEFVWSFDRDERIESDVFIMPLFFATTAILLVLLSLPLAREKRSVGATALGYGLRAENPISLFASCRRTLFGFFTMAAGIMSIPTAAKRDDRRMWHDLSSNVHPVEVKMQ